MILVDTSVWIDHLHRNDPVLMEQRRAGQLAMHLFVLGEIALENIRNRKYLLESLKSIHQMPIVSSKIVFDMIEAEQLFGSGVGYVDCHLLASVRSLSGTTLWTRDKRLAAVASRLGCLAEIA